jgi:predicted ATPase
VLDYGEEMMHLKTVFVRFYKSFNFDYLRKYDPKAQAQRWEMSEGMWYPYVRIPIDPKVTTIVGANESGKSHLLTAIEKGISGKEIKREDFCRYSQFFKVEEGELRWPDFGFEWTDLSEEEREIVTSACGVAGSVKFDRFILFRTNREALTVYLPNENRYTQYDVKTDKVAELLKSLPTIFRIDAKVALPASVPIRWLARTAMGAQGNRLELLGRKGRFELFGKIFENATWFTNAQNVTNTAQEISSAVSPYLASPSGDDKSEEARIKRAELNLAYDLICKVAKIAPESLQELYEAIQNEKEGYANGIIIKINDALAASLNFPHMWVQDRDFRLTVSPREYDLVFTIRDRTEMEYSFTERSSGLRYFLSYYIQYLAHKPLGSSPEILLMDEPDAYLSSQAQHDLLKIFDAFANPEEEEKRPVQVIYVTHSPFLIDKNHAERIRVLEKGAGDEGTRIVRDVSRNHYEPLRSAFGSFLGETTFIGNVNLMVEGLADQIIIAGAAAHLRSRGVSNLKNLDLNRITIVPAGSASHIPYLVYLARGRDIERPAVIVLLDSDKSGKDAKKELLRGGLRRKRLLKEDFILQIGDIAEEKEGSIISSNGGPPIEIEDLIPLPLCVGAAKTYAREVCGAGDDIVIKITEAAIQAKLSTDTPVFDAIKLVFKDLPGEEYHIDKVGFARLVIDTATMLAEQEAGATNEQSGLGKFEENIKVLFTRLSKMQRKAERELTTERVSQRVDRAKKSFLQDYPDGARREQAVILFEGIEAALDESRESDEVNLELQRLRREFQLEDDVTKPIDNYSKFKEGLEQLKYSGRLATQELRLEEVVPDKLGSDVNSTLVTETTSGETNESGKKQNDATKPA